MQTVFGIIIGIFFTIGVAYVHDATINPNPPAGSATIERPMVNWDVVTVNWQDIKARVNAGWRKIQSIG
jgi:hypothetical protein